MTPDTLEAPAVTLPPYNVEDFNAAAGIDTATAEKIAGRILELGADHGFHKTGRSPSPEENAAFRAGALIGFYRQPRDRHDHLIHIYTRGPVEQACEEFGADPNRRAVRLLVDTFLEPVREQRKAAEIARFKAEFEGKLEAFLTEHPQSPAMERAIRATCVYGERGAHAPALSDQSWWSSYLSRKTDPFGAGKFDAPYAPEPSGYTLLVKEAVSVSYVQDAYADLHTTLIPVKVSEPTDIAAARRNLGKIADKIRTHNGWAGSGSSYSLELVVEDDGVYVRMSTRASISD